MPLSAKESKRTAVRKHIEALIDANQMQQGDRLPTEKQLCEQMNVSRITVQTALEDLWRAGRIYRVQGGGTFVGIAPAPVPEKNDGPEFIPLIINNNPPYSGWLELINGAEEYLKSRSCYITVHSPNGDRNREKEIIKSLISRNVRSMMVLPFQNDMDTHFYFDIIRQGIRLVFVDVIPDDLVGNLVCSDNVMGGYLVTRHLLDQGYRRIAMVGGRASSSVRDRVTGYRFALEGAGAAPDEAYLYLDDSISTRRDMILRAPEILDHLFSLPQPPDALFAVNDYTATDLFHVLSQRGIRVPEDIALAGFDNLPTSSENAVPITTVAQDFHGLGYAAAKLCYESSHDNDNILTHRFLPVRLIERESTRRIIP